MRRSMISLIYCYVFPFKMTRLTISSGRIIVRDLQYLRITQPGKVTREPTPGRGLASAGSPPPLPRARPRLKPATAGQDGPAKPMARQKAPCRLAITAQPYLRLGCTLQCAMETPERRLGHGCCDLTAEPLPRRSRTRAKVCFPARGHPLLHDFRHPAQPFPREPVHPGYDGAQGADPLAAASTPEVQQGGAR